LWDERHGLRREPVLLPAGSWRAWRDGPIRAAALPRSSTPSTPLPVTRSWPWSRRRPIRHGQRVRAALAELLGVSGLGRPSRTGKGRRSAARDAW